ncbi:hypothetical protein BDA99DRAFT_515541, partial [Phascolomyces articulosus]
MSVHDKNCRGSAIILHGSLPPHQQEKSARAKKPCEKGVKPIKEGNENKRGTRGRKFSCM